MTNYFPLVNLFKKTKVRMWPSLSILQQVLSFIPSLVFQIRSGRYATLVVFNTGCTFKSHGEFKNTDAKAAA